MPRIADTLRTPDAIRFPVSHADHSQRCHISPPVISRDTNQIHTAVKKKKREKKGIYVHLYKRRPEFISMGFLSLGE